jgi:hypothetical protein
MICRSASETERQPCLAAQVRMACMWALVTTKQAVRLPGRGLRPAPSRRPPWLDGVWVIA